MYKMHIDNKDSLDAIEKGDRIYIQDICYQIERIFTGGMGKVFCLTTKGSSTYSTNHLPTRLAIKAISKVKKGNENYAINKEIQNAMDLRHDNIASLYGCGVLETNKRTLHNMLIESDCQNIALMDRCDYNLKELLGLNIFGPEDALSIIYNISDGLKYAYNKNKLLHLDVKPQNILLKRTEKSCIYQIKISDFGISCKVNQIPFSKQKYHQRAELAATQEIGKVMLNKRFPFMVTAGGLNRIIAERNELITPKIIRAIILNINILDDICFVKCPEIMAKVLEIKNRYKSNCNTLVSINNLNLGNGTIPYMAPERLLGSASPTMAIDIYSMGIVLHEILFGHLPLDPKKPIINQILDGDVSNNIYPSYLFGKARDFLLRPLRSILRKMTRYEQEYRYQDYDSLQADIKKLLKPKQNIRLFTEEINRLGEEFLGTENIVTEDNNKSLETTQNDKSFTGNRLLDLFWDKKETIDNTRNKIVRWTKKNQTDKEELLQLAGMRYGGEWCQTDSTVYHKISECLQSPKKRKLMQLIFIESLIFRLNEEASVYGSIKSKASIENQIHRALVENAEDEDEPEWHNIVENEIIPYLIKTEHLSKLLTRPTLLQKYIYSLLIIISGKNVRNIQESDIIVDGLKPSGFDESGYIVQVTLLKRPTPFPFYHTPETQLSICIFYTPLIYWPVLKVKFEKERETSCFQDPLKCFSTYKLSIGFILPIEYKKYRERKKRMDDKFSEDWDLEMEFGQNNSYSTKDVQLHETLSNVFRVMDPVEEFCVKHSIPTCLTQPLTYQPDSVPQESLVILQEKVLGEVVNLNSSSNDILKYAEQVYKCIHFDT